MKFSHLTSFSQSTVLWTKNIFTFFDRLENSSTFCAYPISTVKAAYLLFVVWWRRGRMVCRKRLRNWLQCRSPHAGRVGRNTAGGRQSCCSCYPGNSGAGHPSRGARGVRSPVSFFIQKVTCSRLGCWLLVSLHQQHVHYSNLCHFSLVGFTLVTLGYLLGWRRVLE